MLLKNTFRIGVGDARDLEKAPQVLQASTIDGGEREGQGEVDVMLTDFLHESDKFNDAEALQGLYHILKLSCTMNINGADVKTKAFFGECYLSWNFLPFLNHCPF